MPQWAGSCWYYLRFTDPHNDRRFASPEALARWGGPDLYVGGAEHAVLHLLYARFWHKVLFDIGAVPTEEPFRKLFHQGIILGEDGEKMAKSGGNAVSPDAIIESHGTDSLRLYLMFLGPLEAMKPWNPRGIEGVHRFLQKVVARLRRRGRPGEPQDRRRRAGSPPSSRRLLHETIRKVGDDIEALRFNTAISQMMILRERAAQGAEGQPRGRADLHPAPRPLRPPLRRGVVVAPGRSRPRLGRPLAGVRPGEDVRGRGPARLPGKREAPGGPPSSRSGSRRSRRSRSPGPTPEVSAFLANKTIGKVVYVPGRILNLVVS